MAHPSDVVDANLVRLKRELEASLATLGRYIESQLAKAKLGPDGKLVPDDPFNLELARETLDRLLDEYESLFGEVGSQLRNIAADTLDAVGSVLTQQGISENLTTPSEGLLALQLGNGLDALTAIKGERSDALRATVLQLFQTNVNPSAAFDVVVAQLGGSVGRALSLVDTTVMAVDRTVSVEQAKDSGFEWFVFSGPVDSLTREWCADRAGKLFRGDEIDDTPNDTGPNPPSAYGGGYNCRHRWDAVDVSEIKQYTRFRA